MNDTETGTLHPARSSDFLSRLHDGEVSAAEASAFDSHRAGCAECRDAAADFARTLAAFRSAEPAPAAADLSARILRKIRAQSPSRRPFGIMFGIDVRWAGVFVAALLVVLISAPALLRRPEGRPSEQPPASIPARIIDASPEKEVANAAPPRPEPRALAPRPAAPPPPAPALAKDEAAAMPQAAASAEAPAEEEKMRTSQAAAPRARAAAPSARRQAPAAEPAGGEPGAAGAMDAVAATPRVVISALDGQGAAPSLMSPLSDQSFAPLRGRQYILVVEAQGRVRDVHPSSSGGFVGRGDAPEQAGALDALHALRFAPGDRPRRLLVRIE